MHPEPPVLRFLLRLTIDVGAPVDLGPAPGGHRRIVPVLGGHFEGPELRGRVLPGGADHQVLRTPVLTELDARYGLETDAGSRIAVHNVGVRTGTVEAMAAVTAGREVPAGQIYFTTTPRFDSADPALAWLGGTVLVARGRREPAAVLLDVFRVS